MDYAFFEQIKNFAHSSKGSKRQVASFLLEHAQDAAFMTVDEVAQRAGVSPGTVSRVAQSMGFGGFQDIQERIRQIIRSNIAPAVLMKRAGGGSFDWRQSVQVDMDNLSSLFSRNPADSMQNTASLLATAPRVHIMGTRSSYALAYFLAFNLEQIRDHVQLLEIKLGQLADAIKLLRPGELFVPIALPRYQRETVTMTKEAAKVGCRVVSITDSFFSPVAKHSEIILLMACESQSFFNSYVAGFALANALVALTAVQLGEASTDALEKCNLLHERYRTFYTEMEN